MDSAIYLYMSNVMMAGAIAALAWSGRSYVKRFLGGWMDRGVGGVGSGDVFELAMIGISLGFAVAMVFALFGINILVCLGFGAGTGLIAPGLILSRRRRQFVAAFEASLVESLTTISSSLRAGLTLKDSMVVAANNCPPAFAKEASFAMKQYRFGMPIDEALDGIRKRLGTSNANIAFGAMIVGSRLGGNLPEVLQRIAVTIRERERVEGKLRALTAQGRTQAFILCSAPPAIGVLMYLYEPNKMRLFFDSFTGQVLFCLAVILELVGIAVTRKVMQLDI